MDAAPSGPGGETTEPPVAPVKDRFTALDTLALVRELQGLVGGRLDKAFSARPTGVDLVFRHPEVGRRELRVVSGRYATLTPPGGAHLDTLDPLARELRRLLSGARLVEVPDPAGERYLELVFQRTDADGPLVLGAELFGQGNVIVARAGVLVAVEHTRRWAHRTVRVGVEYVRPPARLNPLTVTASALEGLLTESRTDRASTLAARLGLGGPLAEELLVRAGIPGTVPAPTEAAEAARALTRALAGLLDEMATPPRGHLYRVGPLLLDVAPVPLRRWARHPGVVGEETGSFSEAAATYFASLPAATPPPPSPRDEATRELERQRERQEAAIEGLRDAEQDLKQKADAILAHFADAERLLSTPPTEADEETILADLGGVEAPLLRNRPVRASAQVLYDEAKRLKGKRSGAEAALSQTLERLELARSVKPRAAPSPDGPAAPAPHRLRWFERYRWFFTSEGILVIGGRDASSNDLIVRRYLNPADVYVHADIHGAPSVVVKHPTPGAPPPTEISLREAGQWGFCFSKAWRAGLASGTAFWVTPEQVSKSAASGEFVARGAWVIHGTKNYLRDLPAELALGRITVEGEDRWTVAPPAAVRARGEVRVLLSPGEERERAAREVELARELGLSRSVLQALLPAGGIAVRRV